MLFCVLFQDNPGKDYLRQDHMADHLAYLDTLGSTIVGAGPLFEGTSGHGGMWLVQADSAPEAQKLVERDPFWPTGLRKSVSILEWRQVFRDGQRT
ncbi:MAG: YciI family protein [Ruegeria sp.]|uniref:YciI family protein n=1 Tax=Ruegeria sp. TaxID=1879320 RepID=UPI00349EE530